LANSDTETLEAEIHNHLNPVTRIFINGHLKPLVYLSHISKELERIK